MAGCFEAFGGGEEGSCGPNLSPFKLETGFVESCVGSRLGDWALPEAGNARLREVKRREAGRIQRQSTTFR